MAKGKNLNPADAYRKAQRKKELKKNKAERTKARDFALVKKDTRDLEDEIEKLESNADASASDKSRLASLKSELSDIMKKKDEYVKEHPEHRRLVYRRNHEKNEVPPPPLEKRNVFDKHGLPRHPERSIYYDPVMNPYGVPPPGMPYIERPLAAGEDDDDDDDPDSDEDIVMPEGPPPGADLDESEGVSDDDIPMPEGPPPGTTRIGPEAWADSTIPLPFPPPPPVPLPPNMSPFGFPPPPLGTTYAGPVGAMPPPPPPPGFFPRRVQSVAAIQDPLLSVPHQTYQAHLASRTGHPSLPPRPPTDNVNTGATISAAPELRDLKKEATSFVPTSLRKKKPSGVPSSSKVNAAPFVNVDSEAIHARPDLVGVLKSQLGVPASSKEVSDKAPSVKGGDDYQKFVDEMNDLLGPRDVL